jgi:acyl carrier protein
MRYSMEGPPCRSRRPPCRRRIQPTAHLVDDLDLDSIDLVDLAVSLEESIGGALAEDELKSVRTVQDAVDAIHAGLVARSVGSA